MLTNLKLERNLLLLRSALPLCSAKNHRWLTRLPTPLRGGVPGKGGGVWIQGKKLLTPPLAALTPPLRREGSWLLLARVLIWAFGSVVYVLLPRNSIIIDMYPQQAVTLNITITEDIP